MPTVFTGDTPDFWGPIAGISYASTAWTGNLTNTKYWDVITHSCPYFDNDSAKQSFKPIMTSSNESIFHVTGLLRGKFTGNRWIPHIKASDAGIWCFLWSVPWINCWVNNHEAGDLRHQRAHYDVIVIWMSYYMAQNSIYVINYSYPNLRKSILVNSITVENLGAVCGKWCQQDIYDFDTKLWIKIDRRHRTISLKLPCTIANEIFRSNKCDNFLQGTSCSEIRDMFWFVLRLGYW